MPIILIVGILFSITLVVLHFTGTLKFLLPHLFGLFVALYFLAYKRQVQVCNLNPQAFFCIT